MDFLSQFEEINRTSYSDKIVHICGQINSLNLSCVANMCRPFIVGRQRAVQYHFSKKPTQKIYDA